MKRILATTAALVLLAGCTLFPPRAPRRFAEASADFHAFADRYDAACVEVVAPKGCDCAAWSKALKGLQRADDSYYRHNVKLSVPGGEGWKSLKEALRAARKAECGPR